VTVWRAVLLTLALLISALLFVLPLVAVFTEALREGLTTFADLFADPDAVAAVILTCWVAAISVAVNGAFGLAAAWLLAKQSFRGRTLLVVLIEIPLSVSPVISGLVWVLLFGLQGWFGPALQSAGLPIMFTPAAVVLATIFVTFPFVVRPLLPLMQEQGRQQEEAATLLGAGLWPIFWHVTLPDIRWGLLAGVLLCNARAMGEFGAVSVVSGHIPGFTETMPLHIEALYNGYQAPAAFAMAALLACLALVTLSAKAVLEWRIEWRRIPAA